MSKYPAVLVLAMIAAGCSDIGCGNEVASRVTSPNGKVDAVVFNRNCGATTGFNTQLSIIPTNRDPTGAGNVLILDDTVALRLNWDSDNALSISGAGSRRAFHKADVYRDVAISYVR